MYADDTHLTYVGNDATSIEACLNEDLLNVHAWLNANKLTLNMTKTEFMLIGSSQRLNTLMASPTVTIDGTQVKQVETAKSLGVTIDDKLNWKCHIENITKKIAAGIGAIKRIRHLVPPAILEHIYHALIQPHFDYCSTVWGSCGVTLQDKLQKLQNRASRVVTFSNYDADASQLLEALNWKSLKCQRNLQEAIMVFKCLHGLAPSYLNSKFSFKSTGYDLRDSENKINVPKPRTNYLKDSFSYKGATLWNSLPREARCSESLRSFKRTVHTAFMESSF